MFKTIKQNLFCKIDASGLAVFRMLYMLVLIGELSQLCKFRALIYDNIPFIEKGALNVELIFIFWFLIAGLIFIGLFTRVATIINYIFSVIVFSSATAFEYHVFKTYVSINFLLMFIPVSRVFSFDALLQKLKYSNTNSFYTPDKKILAANYFVPVLLGLAFVYFDSILFKLMSPMWLNGIGMWLPASLPMVTWNDTSWLLNQELTVKILGYITLLFEIVFIFLFWFKVFRLPLFLVGIFLHIGILIVFPIPFFALAAIALYILLVPVSFWNRFFSFFRYKIQVYKFYYDAECPLCIKTIVMIRHFDIFNAVNCLTAQKNYLDDAALKGYSEQELFINIHGVDKKGRVFIGYEAYTRLLQAMFYLWPLGILFSLPGLSIIGNAVYKRIAGNRLTVRCTVDNCSVPVFNRPVSENEDFLAKGLNKLSITKSFWKYAIIFFFICQGIISWFAPLSQSILVKIKLRYTIVNALAIDLNNKVQPYFTKFLGLSNHGVFLDDHFKNYYHIFKVEYCNETVTCRTVPLIDDKGMPSFLLRGSTWCNFNFNVVSSQVNQHTFEKGILRYLNFYRFHCQHGLKKDGHYIFYVKNILIPKKWDRNFLRKQIDKPWQRAGEYSTYTNSFSWNPLMQDIYKSELNWKF